MKITIKGQDYSGALDAAHPLTIERKLNEPSVCQLWLSLPADGSLAMPTRNLPLTVTGDDGTVSFTGYIAVTPLPEYAGMGTEGPRYRIALQALSDELLLDQLPMPPSKGSSGETAGALLAGLVTRTGASSLSTQGLALSAAVSQFIPEAGAVWSKSAGQVANQARASYRALSGALTLSAVPAAVHPLNETDGSLSLANLTLTGSVERALANDITVCGEHEPSAYVTEYFLGDGATTKFYLSEDPFFPPSSQTIVIHELFDEPQIDLRRWGNPGGNGYLALGPGGLAMNGGSGVDGGTLLSWLDPVELGGTLLLEATGVTLSPGSTGVLAGFFTGLDTQAGCIAGFQVAAQQGTGAVTLQPLVQGTLTGTAFSVNPSNQYALRLRVHCPESQRALAVYRAQGDSGALIAGGQWSFAPASIQVDIQEFVNGVGGMPVTLYDGSIASLPATGTVVAASSTNLIGSMRALNLTNLGSGWVVSTPQGGGAYTRRIGSAVEAAECHLERTGILAFYTGFAPAAGEQVAVTYRVLHRAVGRAVNSASQQSLVQAGLPPVVSWIGTVTSPPARSSADCRNAAQVLQQAASGVSALWSGAYKGARASFATDVWPGDALLLNAPSMSLNAQVVVRTVKISYQPSCPDLVNYVVTFANDWADSLAIKTSATVPADAWLPALVAPTMLANLNNLTVATLNGTTVSINTGVAAPTGGGFEIRRRDYDFMPGEDSGLVMRTSAQNITFPRAAANDRFYIRMYDGATPPNYSGFSTALFVNLPVGS